MEDKNRIVIALLEELSRTQCGLNDLNAARVDAAIAILKGQTLAGILECLTGKLVTIPNNTLKNSYEVRLTAIPEDVKGFKAFKKLYLSTNGKNAPVTATTREIRKGKTVTLMTHLNQEQARNFADFYTEIGCAAHPYLNVQEISH